VTFRGRLPVAILAVLFASSAHALVPPDPSGLYESFCATGASQTAIRCETVPNASPVRGRARLFAREYIPENCATTPCTPAKTKLEGQVTIPRFVDVSVQIDPQTQTCQYVKDAPRYLYLADVYDVLGEAVWKDLRSTNPSAENTIELQGHLVSDPGGQDYVPEMRFSGKVWMLPDIYSSFQSKLCIDLADTPTIEMTTIRDSATVELSPQCINGSSFPTTKCWRRLGAALPDSTGTIEGTAVSNTETFTETDYEVHQATVVVFEQRNGTVRLQGDVESDDDYDDYLRERGQREIRRVQVERRRDGSDSFGAPGRFVVEGLPIFRFLEDLAVARWGGIWYTVEVRDAETDERIPLQGGGTEPNKLLFRSGRAVNVRPDDAPVEIGLDPFGEIGVKRRLIETLTGVCPIHYGPPEEDATAFLDGVEGGEVSDNIDEAIRRAAWAERSVRGAESLAEELIGVSVDGLATLLADAFSDFVKFQRTEIANAKKAKEQLSGTPSPAVSTAFQIDPKPLGKKIRTAVSGTGIDQVVAQGDLASTVKKSIKSLKPSLVYLLQQHGHPDAAAAAEMIVKVLIVLADSIENRTGSGSIKSILKDAIAKAVKQVKPLLIDDSPLSYCAVTDDALTTSVENMSTWNIHDDAVYGKDRREVVQILTRMNTDASDTLAKNRYSQEMAAGWQSVQDAAAVIGSVVKWVKVVEKFAMIARYVLNAESVALPFAKAYATLPGYVDSAVAKSYAGASPFLVATLQTSIDATTIGSGPSTVTVSGAGQSTAAPSGAGLAAMAASTELSETLASMSAALAESRIGDLLDAVGDGTDSLVDRRAAWQRGVDAIFVQASAAGGASSLESPLREATDAWTSLRVVEADFAESLRSFAADVFSGRHANPDAAAYRQARDVLLATIAVLEHRLAALDARLHSLRSVLDSSGFGPAVLLELLRPVSNVTGEAIVASSPETFTVTARATNLGDIPLSGLTIRLLSSSDRAVVGGPQEKALAAMAAFDGIASGTGDQAALAWQVTWTGDFAWELVTLTAELRESGNEPENFVVSPATQVLGLDATLADADGDGMPTDFEIDNGLDAAKNDAAKDKDGDGVSNLAELQLGTSASDADSDDDGLDDGEELESGADGFVTDPLLADSDEDGTSDSTDDVPTDGGNAAPGVVEEPSVELSSSLVVLSDAESTAAVTVTNGGEGVLLWTATSTDRSLVDFSPGPNDLRDGDGLLFVALPDGVDAGAVTAVVATVTVSDSAGADKDSVALKVVYGSDVSAALCGHGNESSVGAPIKASDALATLRASVGSASCPLCRCDTDSSGSVKASDALRVLRAAVGLAVDLDCPAC
jgi:hypothetical protein